MGEAGVNVLGLKIVLIGAGGAARAAAYALADALAGEITIGNRTVERAESLATELRKTGAETVSSSISDPDFLTACKRADLIVNSTSVGMLHGPAEGESPIPSEVIRPGCIVYDMVYNPTKTPLLTDAEKAGARGCRGTSDARLSGRGGLDALDGQGSAGGGDVRSGERGSWHIAVLSSPSRYLPECAPIYTRISVRRCLLIEVAL